VLTFILEAIGVVVGAYLLLTVVQFVVYGFLSLSVAIITWIVVRKLFF